MDEISINYLSLALNLNRHLDGFVDAYFGPPELRSEIENGAPRPLNTLVNDARQLQAAIETSIHDPQRKDFLARQVRAMSAVLRTLSGHQLEYVREVELYFDITPQMVDESIFETAHAEMARLLPRGGSLVERLGVLKAQLELDPDRILPVLDLARKETRRRTLAFFEIPPVEELSLHLVSEKPWGAYNWYVGNYRSRIEINTDLPLRADSTIPLIAHEAYPGHHTEHASKEYHLLHRQGRWEHAVQLLLAPECVVSEGIADNAQKMIFDDAELVAFFRDELIPLAALPGVDPESQISIWRASQALRGVSGNAALLLHREGKSPDEVAAYVERYGLRTPREASQTLRFIQNPLFRSYIFNYSVGKTLLAPLLEGPDASANFHRLLSEPLTPTQVRQWLLQRGAVPDLQTVLVEV